MFTLLKGKPVKDEIINYVTDTVQTLKESGTEPMLAVLRAGEDSGQIYYEQSILKNAAKYGISTRAVDLPESVSTNSHSKAGRVRTSYVSGNTPAPGGQRMRASLI